MSKFWQNMNEFAKAQLFAGGYLSTSTAIEIAEKTQARTACICAENENQGKRTPASQWHLASFR